MMDWLMPWLQSPAFQNDPMYSAPAPNPPNPYSAPSGIRSDYAQMPSLGASLGGAAYQSPDQVAGSVGGNVGAVPLPTPRPAEAGPGAAMPPGGRPTGGGGGLGGTLANAIRGVQAMQGPQAQHVATPRAPQMGKVPASEIINLLSSLGIGPQQAMQMGLGRRF